jgi:hypothetical protein
MVPWRHRAASFVLVLLVLLAAAPSAHADIIGLGLLSLDTFIPGTSGGPGTLAVTVSNLTGQGLEPDFYSEAIDFTDVNLLLSFLDNSTFGCSVVSISSVYTECQVTDTSSIVSILVTGTIPIVRTQDGQSYSSFSARLDDPIPGDLTAISVGTPVPEPATAVLGLTGLLGVWWKRRYTRS